jgi:hypothetical protein
MITASVSSNQITASVTGAAVAAAVSANVVTTATAGGVGPQGPQGVAGTALQQASDVSLSGVTDGDVLRYSASKWRNYPDKYLTDGGNF